MTQMHPFPSCGCCLQRLQVRVAAPRVLLCASQLHPQVHPTPPALTPWSAPSVTFTRGITKTQHWEGPRRSAIPFAGLSTLGSSLMDVCLTSCLTVCLECQPKAALFCLFWCGRTLTAWNIFFRVPHSLLPCGILSQATIKMGNNWSPASVEEKQLSGIGISIAYSFYLWPF